MNLLPARNRLAPIFSIACAAMNTANPLLVVVPHFSIACAAMNKPWPVADDLLAFSIACAAMNPISRPY